MYVRNNVNDNSYNIIRLYIFLENLLGLFIIPHCIINII